MSNIAVSATTMITTIISVIRPLQLTDCGRVRPLLALSERGGHVA
jgi:hypothetical protein